jgi:hypothetical protein
LTVIFTGKLMAHWVTGYKGKHPHQSTWTPVFTHSTSPPCSPTLGHEVWALFRHDSLQFCRARNPLSLPSQDRLWTFRLSHPNVCYIP